MGISITQFDPFQLVPATSLHAPRPLSHAGLELFSVRLPHIPGPVQVPALVEDQLILELDGSARLSGSVERRFHADVQPGMLFIVPRGTPAEWQYDSSHTVMNLFLTPALLGHAAVDVMHGDPGRIEFVPRVAMMDTFVAAAGQALLRTVQTRSTNDVLAAETLMYALIVHLLRRHTMQPVVIPQLNGKMPIRTLRLVLDYIHADLGSPLSIGKLASVAQLSPYHFARQFHATVGQPPHRYVLEQRLAAARLLVTERPLPLASVAAALGFADQSHLNYHFKRRYGVPPGAIARRK